MTNFERIVNLKFDGSLVRVLCRALRCECSSCLLYNACRDSDTDVNEWLTCEYEGTAEEQIEELKQKIEKLTEENRKLSDKLAEFLTTEKIED